jgi:hypothetical protein
MAAPSHTFVEGSLRTARDFSKQKFTPRQSPGRPPAHSHARWAVKCGRPGSPSHRFGVRPSVAAWDQTKSTLAQRKKVLRALDGLAEAPQQLLQILVALHKINFSRVHHEQI